MTADNVAQLVRFEDIMVFSSPPTSFAPLLRKETNGF